MEARQRRLVREKRQLIGCHGNVPWGIQKRSPDRSYTSKYLSFGAQIAKIDPVDPEIICLHLEKKKEINSSKIYSPVGKFAERAKQQQLF